MEKIKCIKCGDLKNQHFFSVCSNKKNKRKGSCKECEKTYRHENKERLSITTKEWQKNNPLKMKEYGKKNYEKNKERKKENRKIYRLKNPDKVKESQKKYYEINRKELIKKATIYKKQKSINDPVFKFKVNVRSLIRISFKTYNHRKKATKTESILGCSLDFFKTYISNQFTKGMTLENHGKWELDHIIPLATAKNEADIIRLNHYTNFQPLWAKDNRVKSDKIIPKQLALI